MSSQRYKILPNPPPNDSNDGREQCNLSIQEKVKKLKKKTKKNPKKQYIWFEDTLGNPRNGICRCVLSKVVSHFELKG